MINFIKCFGKIYSTEITRTALFSQVIYNITNCANSKTTSKLMFCKLSIIGVSNGFRARDQHPLWACTIWYLRL